MNATHFNISDFCISKDDIPKVIADRILLHHLIPLNAVQNCCPFEVRVSLNSGFRPYKWELSKGRNGLSEHTFGQRQTRILESKGASDITCEDFEINKEALLQMLIDNTDYLRITVYRTFIHGDYKDLHNGKRRLFTVNSKGDWVFERFINEK